MMHWDDAKPLLWSAAGGAVAAMVVGFTFGGWMTGGQATVLAEKTAGVAVVDRLAPICLAQSMNDPQQGARMATLTGTDSWRRGDAVAGFGWATMPGDQKADSKVADKCAEAAMVPAKSAMLP
jgi:hypothetical protein